MEIPIKRLAGAALIAGIALSPVGASAARGLYSWQGGDYSYDYKTSYRLQIHDGEDDKNDVKSDYRLSSGGTLRMLYNYDGFNTDKYQSLSAAPYQHRAVEILPYRPDAIGDWVYPR